MEHFVVSVKDRALDCFQRPFFVPALGAGIRAFSDAVNEKGEAMNKHPDDYDLFHLGMFDDVSGKFKNLDEPKQLCIGKQVFIPTSKE